MSRETYIHGTQPTEQARLADLNRLTNGAFLLLVLGDAHQLNFDDDAFDLVYTRYVLEHVADPLQVVREMRRVLRPGGRIAVQENDVGLLRLDPACPHFERVWNAFITYQAQMGGDALIGRRLYHLLHAAGFVQIELSLLPEVHWHGSPGFAGWNARDGLARRPVAWLPLRECPTACPRSEARRAGWRRATRPSVCARPAAA